MNGHGNTTQKPRRRYILPPRPLCSTEGGSRSTEELHIPGLTLKETTNIDHSRKTRVNIRQDSGIYGTSGHLVEIISNRNRLEAPPPPPFKRQSCYHISNSVLPSLLPLPPPPAQSSTKGQNQDVKCEDAYSLCQTTT